MIAPLVKPKLNSHVYLCVFFTILSFTALPMIASLVGVLSGRSAVREIDQRPEAFYGRQAALVCIFASYFSASVWFCLIVGYALFSVSGVGVV